MDWKEALLYSDLYFAIVATGTGIASYALFGLPLSDPWPLLIVSLLALNVCSTNRQIDEETDGLNVPGRTRFLREHGKAIYLASVAGVALAVAISFLRSPWAGSVALLTFLAGHFYSHPFPRVGRLREFFVVKNLTVGLMWALMALMTPLWFGVVEPMALWPLFMLFFMRMSFQTGLIDLRDVEGDAKAGIKTVHIALGRERTIILAQVANLLPLMVFSAVSLLLSLPPGFLLLCLLMSVNGLAYILAIASGFKTEMAYAVGIDSETLIPPLALLLISLIWGL